MPKYDGVTMNDLLTMEREGDLLLPNFQRDFVWERNDQRNLIASFLIDIPIGSILLVEDEQGQYASRRLCFTENSSSQEEAAQQCKYLLDGQQRVSTLKSVFDDFWETDNWKDILDKTYHKLRNRWFIKIKIDFEEKDKDWLGLKQLRWNSSVINKCEPQDIIDSIYEEKIFEKQTDKWFHPGYGEYYFNNDVTEEEKKEIKENPGAKKDILNQVLAEKASEEGWIPLYAVFNERELLNQILENIADKRAHKLEALYRNNPKVLKQIFTRHRKIHKKLKNYDKTDLEIIKAWESLKATWVGDVNLYLDSLKSQEIAVTILDKSEINRAISVFEYMNKQGVRLDVFDLIVARATVDKKLGLSLREELIADFNEEYEIPEQLKPSTFQKLEKWVPTYFGVFDKDNLNSSTQQVFINLLALNSFLGNYGDIKDAFKDIKTEHIKSKTAISLNSSEINKNFRQTLDGLKRAFSFFQFRLGCSKITDISYRLMLLPIAYYLQDDTIWFDRQKQNKLEYWYWTSLFSDSYRDDKQQKVVDDIVDINGWINEEDNNPFYDRYKKVLKVEGWSDKKTLLQDDINTSVHSSIENGILTFILSQVPYDFLPGDIYKEKKLTTFDFSESAAEREELVDYGYVRNIEKAKDILVKKNIHHIAPINSLNFWKKQEEIRKNKDHKYNSPLNLTIISQVSNNIIRDKKLNDYIKNIDAKSLQSHAINEQYLKEIDNDKSYLKFLETRYDSIEGKIKGHLDNLVPNG